MSSVFPGPRFLSLLHKNSKTLVQAKQIHAQLVIHGCQDNSLVGKLVGHYCSKQSTESSKLAHSLVFPRFSHPDKFLFNTLLKCSNPEDSIRIFTNWLSKSSLLYLTERTFVFLLGACARSASSSRVGRIVHGMDKGNHSARKGMILFRRFSYCGDGVSRPTDTTMVCVLSAISQMGLLEVGALVHGYIEKLGFTPG
ncbi:hypothetical protein Bca52824_066026 [Brassica carinata]|uniref:Pentatricopeptide repeat-containing protein n=1 Tax=Brassica carinata TaxID=52824 RepID=A0A8X7UBK2_BRACI|nr:hypothetical protein Bca52824_066026 [Brassica carinata]